MPEFITKFLNQIKSIFGKLTQTQKLIIVGILAVVIVAFVYLFSVSSDENRVLLYTAGLKKGDFERAKTKLDGMGIEYTMSDDRYIFVDNQEIATKARAQLGVAGVVRDVKGWELFNNPEYSTTDFERKINLRRAVTGNIIRHLEALEDIETAEVTISYGEGNSNFRFGREMEDNPLTASVSITPASFSNLRENKKKIKGLRDFIAKAIDRLKPGNVIIIDQVTGVVLTDKIEPDDDSDNIAIAKKQYKMKKQLVRDKTRKLRGLLSKSFPEDRYQITVDIDLDWDTQTINETELKPMITRKDNPNTRQNEGQFVEKVAISEQKTTETFLGQGFIPEGPAGTEPNVGPGMKELVDRNTHYKKETKVGNYQTGTKEISSKRAPYKLLSIRVAVLLDGVWKNTIKDGEIQFKKVDKNGKETEAETGEETGEIKRTYVKVEPAELKKITKLIEASLSSSSDREDVVAVKTLKFDRRKQHEEEDAKERADRRNKKLLLVGVAVILGIIILILLFRAIKKEIDRRRRLREEQFAREQQQMRDEALRLAEAEGLGLDIPPEDKARLEMQENAINLARERPEDVAQLIRTWLVEE